MERLSDGTFKEWKPRRDSVVAVRVKDGEFYWIGWMEDAENYAIQIANNIDNCMLDRNMLVEGYAGLYDAIIKCAGYNDVTYYWEKNSDGELINKSELEYDSEYDRFLSFVRCYERNGKSDEDDHDIFWLTSQEIVDIHDALRDGDYVFVVDKF